VLSSIHSQSPDIAMGVDTGGAGDQGLMFGFACTETDELMPLPIMLAHRLTKGLSCARRDGTLSYLRPDGKSQVTVEYDGNTPIRVDAVVVSCQHSPDVSNDQMRADIIDTIINRVVPSSMMDKGTTQASPAARSSSTPTAVRHHTAAARFPARIPRRSIGPRATWRAISRRTSWRRASPTARSCSWRMRLEWRTRCP
jgi:hypothetical protein